MTIAYYPLLAILAPLTAAVAMGLLEGLIGRKVYKIGVLAQVVALGISLKILYEVGAAGAGAIQVPLFSSTWNGALWFGLYIDRLAAVMMVHITAISTLIYLFSIRYMQQERGHALFPALLSLTTFALLCMISGSNILMLFIFWQLLSWLLCLLAYNYAHSPTVRGAFRTFVILRAGDVAFLSGIVLAYRSYGTLDFRQLFIRAAEVQTSFSLWPGGIEISSATAVTLLIFIGAMSKSAQFPLHAWLPDSLYAPTPVTALLHAGIINAGGFLLNRLAPLYGLSPTTLHLVFATGALTALLGAGMMLTQNDIKKTLGYSTIGQMGYMIMECGLGAFALAIFHLIAHGLFKGTIFLNCGHVIHAARREPKIPAKNETVEQTNFSLLAWLTGFITTLILPLTILLAAHGILQIPLRDSQGVVIFLFFSWVTSSQAILTLYRLRAVGSWKVAGIMLLTLLLVISTYLLAAERFTQFLYPAPAEVASYFHAAALPGWLFDSLIGATAFFVMLGWLFIYAKSHGRTIRMPGRLPEWVSGTQIHLYLFLMNRLYLDGLVFRLGKSFRGLAERLDRSRLFLPIGALAAMIFALPAVAQASAWPIEKIVRFLLVAFMLPLFPLHGAYVAVLTRLSRSMTGYLLSILLPMAGLYGLAGLLPDLPPEILRAAGVLALFGAFYGSIKALVQVRVAHLLAYGSVAFYSILWWCLAMAGSVTPQTAVYAASVALVTGGLLLAWSRVQARYGDLDLNRIGGLARPMPRLAILLAMLAMAAVGLPPFGLFSGYLAMLLSPSMTTADQIPMGLIIILLAWFTASWYLFKLMQQLLFGPHRSDLPYEDLSTAEIAPLVIVLILLLALGVVPYGWVEAGRMVDGARTVMESKWNP
jgi:NADH-quinone oxidoreductase subunit L